MNVTRETALLLQSAGFPQPEIPGKFVFCPTATDILKLMPDAALTFFTKKWVVIETATGDYLSDYHDNPAEACAEAWLAKKETKA